ncbi:MAG TPA: Ig-like domain-containing protein, partial [Vicinamibacteria bacterium]
MTKRLAPMRRAISLVILSTFVLETTLIAEVRMLQSIRPVTVPAARRSHTGTPSVLPAPVAPPRAPQFTDGIVRLSLSSDQRQGNDDSQRPSTSSDGRWTAFESNATNLVPHDNNRAQDILVRDRLSGETVRVSVGRNGKQGNKDSGHASIGGDGRFVAFESWASNLVDGDTNRKRDVFVHDREDGKTTRVSTASDGSQGKDDSGAPVISADGRFVAFESKATNLIWAGGGRLPSHHYGAKAYQQIYLHDRETGDLKLVSISSSNERGNGDSSEPAISGDGRFVAFASEAKNLVPDDTNWKRDIFVHDRETGETTRMSLSSEGVQADRHSSAPVIDDTGQFVAFASDARNLVPGDTNGKTDVFLHDRATGEATRVSVPSDGGQGNRDSGAPSISAGGRFVAFESYASNLVDDDRGDDKDVFVHDRSRGLTIRLTVGNGLASGYRSDDSSDDDSSGDDSGDDDSSEEQGADSSRPAISADGRYVSFDSGSSNLVSDDTNRKVDVFQTTIELNRPPNAVDDEATTRQGVPVDIHVLANDTDPDGDALSIAELSSPAHGSVYVNLDDTLTYTPAATFVGT